jgi:REP element-mobilizing transposase RayT
VITIRSRGRLPHWESTPATYFVTFRLADSLPKRVIERFEFERRDILATARAMKRDLSPGELKRLARLFNENIDKYLDAGSGENYLTDPTIAQATMQALLHFDEERYRLLVWCLMPNHVHVVFRPLANHQLSEILHTWKSYSANQANRILGRTGVFWQREYYDHLVRDEKDFRRVIRYVLDNPRKAKLLNWPWVGARP